MSKSNIKRFEFGCSNFGEHMICIDYKNGDQEIVRINMPEIVQNDEALSTLLNGLGNMLTSLSAQLRSKKYAK